MRLDKFIGSVTDLSRSDAKRAIKDGAITIAGEVVTDPRVAVAADAAVTLHGRLLRKAQARYFMLHKPAGYVCATRDRRHQTVLDLLDEDNVDGLHIAGRLDIDTTGLVLLTDDGRWSHQVTSPHRKCMKIYQVETAEAIAPDTVERFARGLWLRNEKRRLQPACLQLLDEKRARVEISEGRYHQIKRMFAAVGNAVAGLHREQIGGVPLDPTLQEGKYRTLTTDEITILAGKRHGFAT